MSASGASSAKRSRSMLSTGVPTASDRTWAISSSAAISSSDKTAVVGVRSAAARSSYRLVSATGRRMRGATTTVPRPRRRTTRPCWTSRWIACRTVGRLTPSCSASSSSLSSRSPGAIVPAWIASLRFSAIWKYSGIGLVRSSGGLRLALVSMGTSVGDVASAAILSLPPYILLTGHKGGFMFSLIGRGEDGGIPCLPSVAPPHVAGGFSGRRKHELPNKRRNRAARSGASGCRLLERLVVIELVPLLGIRVGHRLVFGRVPL